MPILRIDIVMTGNLPSKSDCQISKLRRSWTRRVCVVSYRTGSCKGGPTKKGITVCGFVFVHIAFPSWCQILISDCSYSDLRSVNSVFTFQELIKGFADSSEVGNKSCICVLGWNLHYDNFIRVMKFPIFSAHQFEGILSPLFWVFHKEYLKVSTVAG